MRSCAASPDLTLRYFAYGSNLHPVHLAERAPSARLLGTARLDGHVLAFRKRGRDGSAKCDVVPAPGAVVHGALYEIDAQDLPVLDAAERGYERVIVPVVAASGAGDATTYRARLEHCAPDLRPYRWYRDLVVLGARHHRLPPDYVAGLEAVPVWDDPDVARVRATERLLARLGSAMG